MIHHISIPARDPHHVAKALVELFGGRLTGFGPYPNCYIAWIGDSFGTAVEVFPVGTEMLPDDGQGQANFRHRADSSPFTATHAAISVQKDRSAILALAAREGWRAIELPRGPNNVIEFWIENAVMLELMTPDMTSAYIAASQRYRVHHDSDEFV